MTEPWTSTALAKVERTTQLASEIRTIVERTKRIIATSREILSAHGVDPSSGRPPRPRPPETMPADALCAAFDALLEAARQAEEAGDPELFTLVERALLQAGERIERAASTLAGRNPPLQ
jgi:hypothetical protein